MRAEQNELITRVGPGTPGGALLRMYWQPVALVDEFDPRRDQSSSRQVSHLSQEDAAAWCFDNISVPTAALDPDTPYTVHVEVRAGDGRTSSAWLSEPGVSLTTLIEIFSRPARTQQQKWNLQAGPIRLKDVRRKAPEAK